MIGPDDRISRLRLLLLTSIDKAEPSPCAGAQIGAPQWLRALARGYNRV